MTPATGPGKKVRSLTRLIEADAGLLSTQLLDLRSRAFPPSAEKELRKFSSGEAAKLIGVTDAYIRQLSLSGEVPEAEKSARGRRQFTLDQIMNCAVRLRNLNPPIFQDDATASISR